MSNAAVNEQANRLATLANGGSLCLYDGVQPATADSSLTTQNLLAELPFSDPAFGSALSGVITANAITTKTALTTGTATWFRVKASDGTPLWDGSVGTSGCDLNVNSVSFQFGANVSVSSLTHTVTK